MAFPCFMGCEFRDFVGKRLARFPCLLMVCSLGFFSKCANSQNIGNDSLLTFKTIKPILEIDTRNSIIKNEGVLIVGFKAGVELDRILRAGFGYYYLKSIFRKDIIVEDTIKVPSTFKFRYVSMFGEYVLFYNKRWEVSVIYQAGIGESFYRYQLNGGKNSYDKKYLFLVEPAFAGYYKFLPWLGLSGGIGYRKILAPLILSKNKLDGGIINLKLKIFIADLLDEICKK